MQKFYTPQEVKEMLRMNINTVYEYIRLGWLPAVKLGNRYRISEEDLQVFLRRMRVVKNENGSEIHNDPGGRN